MFWAESRMLRKLKSPNRGEVEWIASVKQSMPQQERRSFEKVFAHSVVSLSKGRHTPYGRLYHTAYRLFMLSIDMVIVVLGVDVLTSEAVIALRLLIYSGSLSVLGAQRFTTGTYFWLFWPPALFASLVIADGFVPKWKPSWSYLVPTVLIAISISVDLLFGARATAFALKQHDVDMFSITNRILNGENLTKNQQDHINCILENPKCLKTKNNKYWRFSYETVFGYIMLILVAFSILLYDISPTQRPFFFVIDTFEILADTLFILNDAQVAPTLFEELVHRASRQTRALLD
ncbi:hypothetical protein BWQ96_07361 [Gracilariopsis chorda]|uniref:Uncharacterized protein n=1 Tax=Gracilariopsis chorda TaxID=448386 RepID=A0A2V3ILE9_9FLOR|nr:hypothetical protein BWQ96_07361 [Gracilariopsis chorda]|eukprot:PXF42914.1 hypothetical protein BWQ96_07361 [Gracilariopsis chorda]